MGRLALVLPCVALLACDKATVAPDPAPAPAEPAEPEPPPPPPEASPELVATYTDLVHEVYMTDANHCLEAEMEAEDTRYMRSGFSLKLTIEPDGTVSDAQPATVQVQILNYGGEVLKEGDAERMGTCLTTAARDWEFEPVPPSTTTFEVGGAVGD